MTRRPDVSINISQCNSTFVLLFGIEVSVFNLSSVPLSLVLVAIVYSRSKYQNTNRLIAQLGLDSAFAHGCLSLIFTGAALSECIKELTK